MVINKVLGGNSANSFFIIKPNRCTNFTNLFRHENLHVSESSSVRHQEFIYSLYTQKWYVSYRFVEA
jgi:hypothetical protein